LDTDMHPIRSFHRPRRTATPAPTVQHST